jgi:hypothetical protein
LTKENNYAQPMIGEVVHIYTKHENAMDHHNFMNVDSHWHISYHGKSIMDCPYCEHLNGFQEGEFNFGHL